MAECINMKKVKRLRLIYGLLYIFMLLSTNINARSIKYDYFFLEAIRQENKENFASAFALLNHCIEIDPKAAEGYFTIAPYYLQLKKDSIAESYLLKATTLSPNNASYTERLAQYYIHSGKYKEAIATYEKLVSANKNNEETLEILLQLYDQVNDTKGMLKTINRQEIINGISEHTTLTRMQLYDKMGEKDSSYVALQALIKEHPQDIRYRIMLGNWLMQNSRSDEAFKIFSTAIKEEPANAYALSSMYDYYNATGKDSLAKDMRERILLNPNTDAKDKATILVNLIRNSESGGKSDSLAILNLINKMIVAAPQSSDIIELKAAYMTLKNMPVDSINVVRKELLTINPENISTRVQLIQSMWDKKNWKAIIKECQTALVYNPDEMVFYLFEGIAHSHTDNKEEALVILKKGVTKVTQSSPEYSKNLASDCYSILGDLYHMKGDKIKAYNAYDSCLSYNPNNVGCLNNYAYYLSEEGKNLDKAEAMSVKTIQQEPNNSSYLDTYAWILYQQKRYAEALVYMEQTVKSTSEDDSIQHSVIYEHAGDIYLANGDKENAKVFWLKALEKADGKLSATLKRKIKKWGKQ